MSDSVKIARRISSFCGGLWLPHYTNCKLRTDPVYDGVFQELKDSDRPLLDIGCGLGILGMYLRERGFVNRVSGLDYDPGKIKGGRLMICRGGYVDLDVFQGDARTGLPAHSGDVTILDILQFFKKEEQVEILKAAARRVGPGGKLVIRSGLRGANLRFYTTVIGDIFAKCTFWMKAAPICYPSEDMFRMVLEGEGIEVVIRPFWGRTPFNNFMILGKRPVF